jgi:hypothetical protein
MGLWRVQGVSPGPSAWVDAAWWVEFWLAVGDGAFPLGVVDESVVSAAEQDQVREVGWSAVGP